MVTSYYLLFFDFATSQLWQRSCVIVYDSRFFPPFLFMVDTRKSYSCSLVTTYILFIHLKYIEFYQLLPYSWSLVTTYILFFHLTYIDFTSHYLHSFYSYKVYRFCHRNWVFELIWKGSSGKVYNGFQSHIIDVIRLMDFLSTFSFL